MKNENLTYLIKLIVSIIFCLFSLNFLFSFVSETLIAKVSIPYKTVILPPDYHEEKVVNQNESLFVPVRLEIPEIKVVAMIESVGLLSDMSIGLPRSPDNVAWYNKSARPGERGVAIFSGHYGWNTNRPAVFDKLYTIKTGAKIYVEDESGDRVTFVVVKTERYNPTSMANEVFVSKDKNAHLHLITCEGDWDKETKNYSKRLVVFADREVSK